MILNGMICRCFATFYRRNIGSYEAKSEVIFFCAGKVVSKNYAILTAMLTLLHSYLDVHHYKL